MLNIKFTMEEKTVFCFLAFWCQFWNSKIQTPIEVSNHLKKVLSRTLCCSFAKVISSYHSSIELLVNLMSNMVGLAAQSYYFFLIINSASLWIILHMHYSLQNLKKCLSLQQSDNNTITFFDVQKYYLYLLILW